MMFLEPDWRMRAEKENGASLVKWDDLVSKCRNKEGQYRLLANIGQFKGKNRRDPKCQFTSKVSRTDIFFAWRFVNADITKMFAGQEAPVQVVYS